MNLIRLIGELGTRNPWRSTIPTLTTKAIIACRCRVVRATNGFVKYHILDGSELMSFTGWPATEIKPDMFAYSSRVLTSFAGNAYSGFPVQSLLTAFIAALGPKQDPVAPTLEEEGEGDSDSASLHSSSHETM